MTTTGKKIPIFLLLYFGHSHPSGGMMYTSKVGGTVRHGSRLVEPRVYIILGEASLR